MTIKQGFTVSVSGTKEEAKTQIDQQVEDGDAADTLTLLIDHTPGNRVSLSGSINVAEDGKSGSIVLSGSFWTVTEPSHSDV